VLYALSLAQLRGKKELSFLTIPTWITNDLFHLNDARELQQVDMGDQCTIVQPTLLERGREFPEIYQCDSGSD
jgi:hypothetical protein